MLKKLLKILGSFFLVLFILLVGGFIWFSLTSSEYIEEAKPYLDQNLPDALSWDLERLKPLLTPEAEEAFETDRGKKVYRFFSRLGQLKSFEEPEFLAAKSGVSIGTGSYDITKFSMLGEFENGPAQITVTLASVDSGYKIHYLHLNSDVFLE